METTASCEPICGARASPRGSAKRNRKPDLPIYVPKQVRERQKVIEAQETLQRSSCGPVSGDVPFQQINTDSVTANEVHGTAEISDTKSHVNSILNKCFFRDSTIGVNEGAQTKMKETETPQKFQCTDAQTVDVATKVIDCMIVHGIQDVHRSATRRKSDPGDTSFSVISTNFTSKCTLADHTDSQVQSILEPQICDTDTDNCACTSADADTRSPSDDESESFRERERERLTNATNAVEVSGFPAEFDETAVRNMVHFSVERIVWVDDTRCVCVFECVRTGADISTNADSAVDCSTIISTDALIERLRARLAADAPHVRVAPLVEADASSKRKWMYVERHRRQLRAGTEPVPPRPRTSAVVANRMILRALGRTPEQCASAND